MAELVAFVEQNKERPVLYMVYVDKRRKKRHCDSVPPGFGIDGTTHEVAGSKFQRFAHAGCRRILNRPAQHDISTKRSVWFIPQDS